MGTKTISIMDDVYEMLDSLKAPNESFSDELRRLAKSKGNILDLAGSWKDISEEDAKNMKKLISNMRSNKRLEEIRKA